MNSFRRIVKRYRDWRLTRGLQRSARASNRSHKLANQDGVKRSISIGDLIFYRMDDDSLQIDFIGEDLHQITVVPKKMESFLIDFIMGV